MRIRNRWTLNRVVIIASLGVLMLCIATLLLYPIAALANARSKGVFLTPQEGVAAIASRWYCGFERVEFEHEPTDTFDKSNPHIYYVIYRVYAKNLPPCDPTHPGPALHYGTYERGGNYYLNMRDGWVMMGEGYFPEYVGAWMKVFGLAGPGNATPIPGN
jgi:hypothetical protein